MWSHLLCEDCYQELEPGREPSRLPDEFGDCCRCGEYTESGIMYREDPRRFGCEGNHGHAIYGD